MTKSLTAEDRMFVTNEELAFLRETMLSKYSDTIRKRSAGDYTIFATRNNGYVLRSESGQFWNDVDEALARMYQFVGECSK